MRTKTKKESLEERARMVLGLAREAEINPKELRRAFRRKAKKYHPDTNKDNESVSEQIMKLILGAREVLKGDYSHTDYLENETLIRECLGRNVEELGQTYQEWLIKRGFYNFLGT